MKRMRVTSVRGHFSAGESNLLGWGGHAQVRKLGGGGKGKIRVLAGGLEGVDLEEGEKRAYMDGKRGDSRLSGYNS